MHSSGRNGARAPKISGGTCLMTFARARTGAGNLQLRMQPSGTLTWIGRTRPSLLGILEVSMHLIGYTAVAQVMLYEALIAALRCCGDDPAKSMYTLSPRISSR